MEGAGQAVGRPDIPLYKSGPHSIQKSAELVACQILSLAAPLVLAPLRDDIGPSCPGGPH